MKKTVVIAVLAIILLLAGCAEQSIPVAEPLPPEEMARLGELAALHERYGGGEAIEKGKAFPFDNPTAFGFLLENGVAPAGDGGEVLRWRGEHPRLMEDASRLLFEKVAGPDGNTGWDHHAHTWPEEDAPAYSLEVSAQPVERWKDGGVSVTYLRQMEGAILCPVTYRFSPCEVKELPESLRGLFWPGEAAYRIAGVTQRPDLLPDCPGETIEIATAEELLAAAERINKGDYRDQNNTYLLTADIDLAGVEWTPMGLNLPVFGQEDRRDPGRPGFNSTFDGQGHAVRGLTITQEQSRAFLAGEDVNIPRWRGMGLFYLIGEEGVVRDLRLEGASVALPLEYEGLDNQDISSAGLLAVDCRGLAERVTVQGKVQGVTRVGGLVGSLQMGAGLLRDCAADVEVTGYNCVGGLAGELNFAKMEGCAAAGSVTGAPVRFAFGEEPPGRVGGAVGLASGGSVSGCSAAVRVAVPEGVLECVGSFCGWNVSGGCKFTGCTADPAVAGNREKYGRPAS